MREEEAGGPGSAPVGGAMAVRAPREGGGEGWRGWEEPGAWRPGAWG